jgi:hypothetical protein
MGMLIPVIDDPEGNMVELFPNIDHMELPPQAFCPRENAAERIASVQAMFNERTAKLDANAGVPLLLFERAE